MGADDGLIRPVPRHAAGPPPDPARSGPTRRFSRRVGRRVGRWVERAVLAVAVLFVLGYLVGGLAGYRSVAIRSGSMGPTIVAGDMVISRSVPVRDLRPGDIVTFRSAAVGGQLVTHRVAGVEPVITGGAAQLRFVTRGDANTATETWTVPADAELGRAVGHVPRAGWWFLIMETGAGRVAVVLICCVLAAAWGLRVVRAKL